MRRSIRKEWGGILGCCVALGAGAAFGNPVPDGPALADLTTLSLEELLSIEVTVTSAAKRPQRLGDTAAAAFVLTGDEIRRSGVMTIPDALRLVPGVQVAQIDANKWAVSVRGFNGRYANKLLVLIDGRSVYTPVFSGVFWEREGVFLEDIDRIEVIRGPGAALWGANAVNGVINIITKPASKTQGGLVTAHVGTEERGGAGVRYGGQIGGVGHYRVYAEARARDAGVLADGTRTNDTGKLGRTGFRTDLALGAHDTLTVQGDLFKGNAGEATLAPLLTPPFVRLIEQDERGVAGNLLGRWTRRLSNSSHVSLQAYYQHSTSDSFLGHLREETMDVELEHGFALTDRQDVLWGVDLRHYQSDLRGSYLIGGYPNRIDRLVSMFAQDEITLVPSRLKLTLGSKFEHNDYTGFEVQPSVRLAWTPHPDHTVWAAASRAVRTPSRSEDDFTVFPQVLAGPGGLPLAVNLRGNQNLASEKLIAFELGYRVHPVRSVSLDAATFYNLYSDLRSFEAGIPFLSIDPVPHLVLPVTAQNQLEGRTYGIELAGEWEVRQGWRLRGSYSLLHMHLHPKEGSTDAASASAAGGSPKHQLVLRSSHDLTPNLDLDVVVRAVDELPAFGVPGYVGLDMRLAWRPHDAWEVALVGQNLLGGRRQEFKPDLIDTRATRVQRGVYAKLTRRF